MSDRRHQGPHGPPTTTTLAALGRAASEVAHDIDNALTAIVMHASLIRNDATSPPAVAHAEAILRAARAASDIVERVRGRLRNSIERPYLRIDLRQLVADALVVARARASRKGVSITSRADPVGPVAGERAELLQLVTNLVNNAVDASEPGQDVTVALAADGEHVALSIVDRGPGIPAALIERVFEPFFTTKGKDGSGLGLSLARSIAESHGGALALESRLHGPARGTTALVTLPLAAAEGPAEPGRITALELQAVATGARLVVVDDDGRMREALGVLLTAAGFEALGAATVEEARALIDEHRPELVVTDLNLGQGSGLTLVQALATALPELPIVVVSAATCEIPAALSERIAARFDKPVSPQRLIACVRALVAERRAARRPDVHSDRHADPEE